MKCEHGSAEEPCSAPPSYRGPSGWLCNVHWDVVRAALDRIHEKAKLGRRRRDTD